MTFRTRSGIDLADLSITKVSAILNATIHKGEQHERRKIQAGIRPLDNLHSAVSKSIQFKTNIEDAYKNCITIHSGLM